MKKKNLSSLILRKNKISNLYKLREFVGGTDTEPATDTALVTAATNCGESCPQECNSINPTDCQTNDKTGSLQPPSFNGIDCNVVGSLIGC